VANHFLHISDYSTDALWDILKLAKKLKQKFRNREKYKIFNNKSLAMIFAKPSARTRVSFETGFYRLGGHALYLGPNDIGIGKRESVADVARVLSRFNDIIMARLFDHKHIVELANFASVPVINGLTDFNHPCQIMADILTVIERKEDTHNLKISYIGDGNNIVHSWLELAMIIPLNFNIICPDNFKPDMNLFEKVRKKSVSTVTLSHDPVSGIKNSDVVYTDVWA
jgi:ornithine carbamoyltransferase